MQEHVHKALTRAITLALKHDSVTQEALAKLSGKTLCVTLTDWRLDMLMTIQNDGNILVSAYNDEQPADASIEGTLSGFLSTAIQGGDSATAREAGVTVHGDLGVAQSLQHIIANLDIDWDGALSSVVGNSLAQIIGDGVRGFMGFAKRVREDMRDHTARYLTAESDLLPTRQEVSQFIKGVTILRHDTDRLIARLDAKEQTND